MPPWEKYQNNSTGPWEKYATSLPAEMPEEGRVPADGVERQLGRTVRTMATGVASVLDAPRIVTDPLFVAGREISDALGFEDARDFFARQVEMPTFAQKTRQGLDEATDYAYAPQNMADKVTDFAGELTTAMMTPAALERIGKGGYDLLKSGYNGIRGFFTEGKKLDSGTKRVVNILLEEGKSPDEIIAIAKQAKENPVKTTVFEQAGSPKGLSMQRALAEQPNKAGTELSRYNLSRLDTQIPQAVDKASGAGADTTSKLVSGSRIKDVSDDIIKEAIKARKEATRPLYEAAEKIPVVTSKGTSFVDDLASKNPAIAAAKRRVDTEPALQQLLRDKGIKPSSAGYLEKVRGELVRQKQAALADPRNMDRQTAAGVESAMNKIDNILKRKAPDIVKGRTEFAAASPEVTKLQKGIVGKLATAKSPEKAADIILREPVETIQNLRNTFLQKDPQAWKDLTASMLTEKGLRTQDSLAQYLAQVDKALIRPKIKAMLTPSQYKAHRLLVKNLRAIQKGLPRNSETMAKALATAEIEGSGGAEKLAQAALQKKGIADHGFDLLLWVYKGGTSKWRQGHKEAFARAITNPDIEALGKALERVRPASSESIRLIENYMLPYIAAAGESSQLKPKARNNMIPDLRDEFNFVGEAAAAEKDSTPVPVKKPAFVPSELKQDEGMRKTSYMDTTGNRTVGIGFNMDSGIAKQVWKRSGIETSFDDVYNEEAGITDDEAARLANTAYAIAREDAESLVPRFAKLSENRQKALLNLSYQMGKNRLSGFKKFLAAMNSKDYRLAGRELINSKWYEQTQESRKRRIVRQIVGG